MIVPLAVTLLPRSNELHELEPHLAPRPAGTVLRAVVLERGLTRVERKKTGSANCCYTWQFGPPPKVLGR